MFEIGSINVTDQATELGEFANEAVRDVLLRTGVKVATGTITLTANQGDYTLDDEVLAIKHAYLDGATSDYLLTQISTAELIERRVYATTGSSDGPWYYALEGTDLFRVSPTPSAAATINITYVPKPTEMSSDAHDPSAVLYGGIPVEFHPVLIDFMCWKAASYDDDASSGQGERYRGYYEEGLKRIRRYVNGKGGVKLPPARVGRRRRLRDVPSRDI